jgi:glucans biosynthesis protein
LRVADDRLSAFHRKFLEISVVFFAIRASVRRPSVLTSLSLSCLGMLLGAAQAHAFSLDDVTAKAKALVDKPYAVPASNLPPVFSRMQFADYMKIQPRADKVEWKDLDTPFKLSFYHQGMHFNTPVRISEITPQGVQEIRYDPERFHFGDLHFDKEQTSRLGYAGFRVLYPINQKDKQDEIMSVLGASYFRVIGKGQVYGLSARGLAIDTALTSGEEFPAFREFWIERPKPQDRQLVIYALMDSQRATGAYRFTLRPGDDAVLDVQSRVFSRSSVNKIGIAPLTSMFLFGPNQRTDSTQNYRPALHDSNGLAIHTGDGEWLWRPLNNPRDLAVSTFRVNQPKGFGLLQRGREFSRYEDLKDRYDLRPSAWIEPQGDWGKGQVELVEIPTPDETNDNIVAFWTPDAKPAKGQPMQYDYRMHWTMNEPALIDKDVAYVKQTLRTAGEITQANLIRHLDGSVGLLVDFEGASLANLPTDASVRPVVSYSGNAEILHQSLERNPVIRGYRINLRVKVNDPSQAVELRAAVAQGDKVLSETWSYQIPPNSVTVAR